MGPTFPGINLDKILPPVDPETQLYGLENRKMILLGTGKFSDTDSSSGWLFTEFKKKMFKHTSSKILRGAHQWEKLNETRLLPCCIREKFLVKNFIP
ncbi:MAG: hypothetical protein CM15mP62_26520 [Rhodospirillaceae bacterium]|nr:MAG: hypothetical protein CM15mP62_26520 [Rhodospirillaceae bacterium]